MYRLTVQVCCHLPAYTILYYILYILYITTQVCYLPAFRTSWVPLATLATDQRTADSGGPDLAVVVVLLVVLPLVAVLAAAAAAACLLRRRTQLGAGDPGMAMGPLDPGNPLGSAYQFPGAHSPVPAGNVIQIPDSAGTPVMSPGFTFLGTGARPMYIPDLTPL